MKKPKNKEESGEAKILTSQEQVDRFLKQNKEFHYNFEEEHEYKVSSGSLLLDYYLDGGFTPGLHRLVGFSESGKTSISLMFLKNFLDKAPKGEKRRGILVKAEGRLSKQMQGRVGVKFVWEGEGAWEDGTCLVLDCNVYEKVVTIFRELVMNNSENIKYFFIIDSIDALIKEDDLTKSFNDSDKIAGGAVIAASFMKRMALSMQKRGHIAVFISQVRADIQLDPYSKAPIRQTTATGGNALLHYANFILQFEPRFKTDLILQNPKENADAVTNPIIGHFAKVIIKKSPNEKTNTVIKYPIKYGRKNGTSNWIEKEILDFLLMWEVIEKKGAWMKFEPDFVNAAKEHGLKDFPEQVQGQPKFELLIEDEATKKFMIDYVKNNILNQ
jgi:RecA/RadA recombinase